MKYQIIFIISALVITQLPGCASTQYESSKHNGVQTENALAELNQWEVTAKLGLKSAIKAQLINLNWQQQAENYQIKLYGLAGLGATRISGNNYQSIIKQGTNTFTDTPEQLGLQFFGVPLPVGALSWWIKGLPSPNHTVAKDITMQHNGLINSFEQQGWDIRYLEYAATGPYFLPKKISGRRGELSFKLVITRWHIKNNKIVP
mgnify:CR=1 FL=1